MKTIKEFISKLFYLPSILIISALISIGCQSPDVEFPPPVVADLSFSIDADNLLFENIVESAAFSGKATFRIIDEVPPEEGVVELKPGGDFRFIPGLEFRGETSFRYQARSNDMNSNIGTVNITVHSVNDIPVVPDEIFSTSKNNTLENGVWADDPGSALTFKMIDGIPPGKGAITFQVNGDFRYEPPNNFTGNTSFTYQANDGTADSNIGTVTLIVTPD